MSWRPEPTSSGLPTVQPGAFPVSLRAFVERALSRYKDDSQKAACLNIMKEMITRRSSEGTLFTKDWDTESLFALPKMAAMSKELQSSTAVSYLPKYKRSPSRRTKSRWEPIAEENVVEKMPPVTPVSVKSATWNHAVLKKRTKRFLMENGRARIIAGLIGSLFHHVSKLLVKVIRGQGRSRGLVVVVLMLLKLMMVVIVIRSKV